MAKNTDILIKGDVRTLPIASKTPSIMNEKIKASFGKETIIFIAFVVLSAFAIVWFSRKKK